MRTESRRQPLLAAALYSSMMFASPAAAVPAPAEPAQKREIDQAAGAPKISVDYVVEVTQVELYPLVRYKGAYVRELVAEDFILLDGDEAVPIDAFTSRVTGVDLHVLIDLSGSMGQVLQAVKRSAIDLVNGLEPADRVFVYSFSHEFNLVSNDPEDHAAAAKAIASLSMGGGSAIYRAIDELIDGIESIEDRNVIFLFSDGLDLSNRSPRKTARTAAAAGVIIYAVDMGPLLDGFDNRRDLLMLTGGTGGEPLFISRPEKLRSKYEEIVTALKSQYTLGFSPRPGPPGRRTISLTTVDRRYQVRSRTSYVYD